MQLLGLEISFEREVYEPAEDSLLIARNLDAREGEACLEIGTGSGLLALVMARAGGRVVATDLSPVACRLARRNARANSLAVDVVQCSLAEALEARFDLVACNPPYLPTAEGQRVKGVLNRAFDGGPEGADVAREVIAALPELLAEEGRAFLLVSDLQPLVRLKALANILGLTWQVVEQEAHDGEGLACIRLERA